METFSTSRWNDDKSESRRRRMSLPGRLLAPYFEIMLHEMIRNVNHNLLGGLRISHQDCVDDTLLVCDLRHPRATVQILTQSAHQRKPRHRNNHPQTALQQERTSRLFQYTNVRSV